MVMSSFSFCGQTARTRHNFLPNIGKHFLPVSIWPTFCGSGGIPQAPHSFFFPGSRSRYKQGDGESCNSLYQQAAFCYLLCPVFTTVAVFARLLLTHSGLPKQSQFRLVRIFAVLRRRLPGQYGQKRCRSSFLQTASGGGAKPRQ